MRTIIKFGFAVLAAGALFASTVQARADEYASESSNYFTKHGLPIPGAYFKAKENQQATTIAISKSGQGVGAGKQTVPKVEKKRIHHVRSTTQDS
jgi:hypothetical protein